MIPEDPAVHVIAQQVVVRRKRTVTIMIELPMLLPSSFFGMVAFQDFRSLVDLFIGICL